MLPPELPEDQEECDSCGWKTRALEHYDNSHSAQREGWLCEPCASTPAGNAFFYPGQYDNVEVLQTICWGINYLAVVGAD